jgi:hypothetical protein
VLVEALKVLFPGCDSAFRGCESGYSECKGALIDCKSVHPIMFLEAVVFL